MVAGLRSLRSFTWAKLCSCARITHKHGRICLLFRPLRLTKAQIRSRCRVYKLSIDFEAAMRIERCKAHSMRVHNAQFIHVLSPYADAEA